MLCRTKYISIDLTLRDFENHATGPDAAGVQERALKRRDEDEKVEGK